MSKEKKAAFAAKQKAASTATSNSALTPLGQDTQMPKTAKKAATRKQSRGK